jgi:hypothetical protein
MSDWIRDAAHEAMRDLAEALQAMRGVALVVAVTVVAEVGDFRRFANARRLMAHLGLLPQRARIREYNPTRRHHQGRQRARNNPVRNLENEHENRVRKNARTSSFRGAGIAREPGTTVSFSASC